jgi:hypothetical protein
MACARQIIGRGDADDATAEYDDFHDPLTHPPRRGPALL